MGRRAETKLFAVQKLTSPNGNNWYMIQGRPTGKRERYYFKTEPEAKKAAANRNRQIAAFGSQVTLSDPDRVMAAECIKILSGFGKTLYDATHYYRDHLEKTSSSISVGELCDRVAIEFDRRLKGGESSERHYTSMRETLKKFHAKFASVPIKVLEGTTIKGWLALEPLAVKTRNRHLGYIRNIFGIAREWNLLDTDPFDRVEIFNDPAKGGRKIEMPARGEYELNGKFSISAPQWFGWQMNPGYIGERCVPYFSPIHITRVTPLKTGNGILEIDFWNVCYAEGVQNFDGMRLKVL